MTAVDTALHGLREQGRRYEADRLSPADLFRIVGLTDRPNWAEHPASTP